MTFAVLKNVFIPLLLLPYVVEASCIGRDCTVTNFALIYGLVFGIIGLITVACCIWAFVRWKRTRDFQRDYFRDAQARVAAIQQQNNAMAAQYAQYPGTQYPTPPTFSTNGYSPVQQGAALNQTNLSYGDPNYGGNINYASGDFPGRTGAAGTTNQGPAPAYHDNTNR